MEKIGVVGAGMMGAEIALVFALAGHQVYITDRDLADVEAARRRLGGVVSEGIAKRRYPEEAAAALDRIEGGESYAGYADCGIVIEAVFEDADVKGEVYGRLAEVVQPDCVLATNTSSISITTLASVLPDAMRSRFVGAHFFSPVSRMKLVEVIAGLDTGEPALAKVEALLAQAGKETVRVKDVVGFAVNRMLQAFFLEAIRLVEEGAISVPDLDKACRLGLGHPVGPFELMDVTTNSLSLQVEEILHRNYGARFLPPPLMRAMVSAGYNGKKAGRGWYRYSDGKRVIS
jgi:3-hydroxybutyryl-CoA dehydrogenase